MRLLPTTTTMTTTMTSCHGVRADHGLRAKAEPRLSTLPRAAPDPRPTNCTASGMSRSGGRRKSSTTLAPATAARRRSDPPACGGRRQWPRRGSRGSRRSLSLRAPRNACGERGDGGMPPVRLDAVGRRVTTVSRRRATRNASRKVRASPEGGARAGGRRVTVRIAKPYCNAPKIARRDARPQPGFRPQRRRLVRNRGGGARKGARYGMQVPCAAVQMSACARTASRGRRGRPWI